VGVAQQQRALGGRAKKESSLKLKKN